MKTRLLKYIDRTCGALLARILTAPRSRSFPPLKKILVIRPGGIGDAVYLIPALKVLCLAYPEAVIDVLAEKRNVAVFAFTPDVARTFRYDKLPELLRVIKGRYDLVIDTEQWHRLSAVITRLVGPAQSIGYATNERQKLFTDTLPYSHDDHETASFMQLLAPRGIVQPICVHQPFLKIPSGATEKSAMLLGGLVTASFVVIFPGASIAERRWGWGKFREVAGRLNARGISVVVVGGGENAAEGEKIIDGRCGLNLAGKTSLAETAAVIEKAAILVSGDSGILHIGVGLGKPTVSLFGPGIAKKWAPRGENHIVINKRIHCAPCTKFGYTPKCPINAKCMTDITVDEVFEAVFHLLEKTGPLLVEEK